VAEQLYLVMNGGAHLWTPAGGLRYLHYVDPALFAPGVPGNSRVGRVALTDTDKDGRAEAVYDFGGGRGIAVSYAPGSAAPTLTGVSLYGPDNVPRTQWGSTHIYDLDPTPWDTGVPMVRFEHNGSMSRPITGNSYFLQDVKSGAAVPLLSLGGTGSYLGAGRFTDDGEVRAIYHAGLSIFGADLTTIQLSGKTLIDQLRPGTQVVGIGNFAGAANRDEILFQQDGTRELIAWDPAKGSAGFRGIFTPNEGWSVVTTGDLTGDGIDDVVVRYAAPATGAATTVDGATAAFDFMKGEWHWIGVTEVGAIRGIAPLLTPASPPPASAPPEEIGLAGLPAEGAWG